MYGLHYLNMDKFHVMQSVFCDVGQILVWLEDEQCVHVVGRDGAGI